MLSIYFYVISHKLVSASLRKPCGFFPMGFDWNPTHFILGANRVVDKRVKQVRLTIGRVGGWQGYSQTKCETLWAPKLVWAKKHPKSWFLLFVNYDLMSCEVFPQNHFHKLWDFLMFYQIFLSPQVKRCAIITRKHGIYLVPHELPNVGN